ncbi:radical SAM protein [Acetohalobium arabaticum]|uniref:Radical SAM domain protein n=1 Tax=Acetohalobium arabaticum (strain ATCC 49924 / DSM 5501 / Z-7288) TaxID=574087 RepID=D9QR70_ACEAZ|nr:radical SAM protein [Acetohalobium arabaticum]ADL13011.1 Radical SAM domain protein [Acetohalobium arabaticum DSM 5501]
MRYEGKVYRPPSEASSVIIQSTVGCPHNQCNFCNMYKEKKFKIRPIEEIKEDLDEAKNHYGVNARRLFLADGNSILMKTDQLIEVLEYAYEVFPDLERVTTYGSAYFIALKSLAELRRLQSAGLTRIHSGMESGDNEVLEMINKGVTFEEIVEAGRMVKAADIELSEYYMVGVGGTELSQKHAINSARALNQIDPDFIRLRTFIPLSGTPMYQQYKTGELNLLSPHQALQETKMLIQNFKDISSQLLSDHISNYWDVSGKLPEDKNQMIQEINRALEINETEFRDPASGHL